MKIELNKNANLLKILDSLIDIVVEQKSTSTDLLNFIELFSLDIDDIKFIIEDLELYDSKDDSSIINNIYSNIEEVNKKSRYSFFLNNINKTNIINNIKKIISITYIYQRFYNKTNSIEFLISIRYLSYDYGSYLYDINGEKEHEMMKFSKTLDDISGDETKIKPDVNYKYIFDFYKPNIFYEKNDELKKIKDYKQLKATKYYFVKNEALLTKHHKNGEVTYYDISKDYVPILNVSKLEEASFKFVGENLFKNMNKYEPSRLDNIDLSEENFNNIYKYFTKLFSLTKIEYRNYIVNLVFNIINRNSPDIAMYSKFVVTGYICCELDIGIREKEYDSTETYHNYFKDNISRIIKLSF